MSYRRFAYIRGGWRGYLSTAGWASFRSGTINHHVSMKVVGATQKQAEAYVRAKIDSLARGEPLNTYIPGGE